MSEQNLGYKRVSFRLKTELASLFLDLQQEKGISQAKLIREWIRLLDATGPEVLRTLPPTPLYESGQKWRLFNLRLNFNDLYVVESTASTLGVSQAEVLRRIVSWATRQSPLALHTPQLEFGYGRFSSEQLLNNAHKSMKEGNLRQACTLVDCVEERLITKSRVHEDLIKVDIVRAVIARHRRELNQSKSLLKQALGRASEHKCANLRRMINIQLSVLAEIEDKAAEAKVLLEEDESNLNLKLRLLGISALDHEYGYIESLLDSLPFQENEDTLVKVKILNRLALVDIRLGDLAAAFQRLEISYSESKQVSAVERRYAAENLGSVYLFGGNYSKARELLCEARKLETVFRDRRNTNTFSKNRLFELIIEAKNDFRNAFAEASDLVELQHQPIYQGLGRYLLYTMQFLYGELAQQKIGQNKLRQLINSAPNQMLRNAAEMTLKHKVIWPVI